MAIATFSSQYLDATIQVWNQTLAADPIDLAGFTNRVLLDSKFDAQHFLLMLDGRQVVGFLWATADQATRQGWLIAMGVLPQAQHQRRGASLVTRIQQIFVGEGAQQITLAAYPASYLFPGVDTAAYPNALPFFQKLGFVKSGEAVSMQRSLVNYHRPINFDQVLTQVEALGIKIRPFQLSDTYSLLMLLSQDFAPDWQVNVRQAIKSGLASRTIIVAVNQHDEIIGYCQRAIDASAGRFGPFGVRSDMRRQHLGYVLFHTMLITMVKQHIYHVYFFWTDGDAQRFYAKNGLIVYRSYSLLKQTLAENPQTQIIDQ